MTGAKPLRLHRARSRSRDRANHRAPPRELGRWDLTAIGVNQVIGSAIFLLPADVAGAGRSVGAARVRRRRVAVALDRALLRRSRQPLRIDRRSVSAGARGLRPLRRLRSRLDDVVHARRQPRLGRQRPDAGARVLLAGARARRAARCAHHRRHARADVDQRARHQAVVVGGQRADDRQAAAAGAVHRRRDLVHRSVALRRACPTSRREQARPRRCC